MLTAKLVRLDTAWSATPQPSERTAWPHSRRTVTGQGFTRRRLYTTEELSVLEFMRPVILTSIGLGILPGDLAERCLLMDLAVLTGDGSSVWTARSFGKITTAASSPSGMLYIGTSTGRIFAVR